MKKLLKLYEQSGIWLSQKGNGYKTRHMLLRVLAVLYGVPYIIWGASEEALKATSKFANEVYRFIRFNR